jgi:hypothetical protein
MPLTDSDIEFAYNGTPGVALVWVIDEECLYDAPLSVEHAEIFMHADEVVDISTDYPDHEGMTIRFLQSGDVKLELMTTEYFGSILLSNPLVVRLDQYPYGLYVVSPHARFDGEKFIILNQDTTDLPAWMTGSSCCS